MNWRAFNALIRREIFRGRHGMITLAVVILATAALGFILSREMAYVAAGLSACAGIIVVFAPLGDLRQDKSLGHFDLDRVLPASHRTIAAARLIGAGVRTSPLLLVALPFIVAANRGQRVSTTAVLLCVLVPFTVWLLVTAFVWMMMAVNLRWNLRRLWWVPMTIFIGPNILISALPPAVKQSIGEALKRAANPLGSFFATPLGIAVLIVTVLAIPIGFFWMSVSVFASGLDRYIYDQSGSVSTLGAPPRRELAAIGRGPALAVARYCIRLATEQSRRRFVLLAVFVAVLVFGSLEMRGYAKFYVRALAAMIPGGIALHLSVARTRGHLEGIQQLPHTALTIGVGYLLAVAVLATPGTAVWVLARAVTGTPATVSNALSLWAWMVGWSWLASVTVIWLTTRRMLMIGSAVAIVLIGWAVRVGAPNIISQGRDALLIFREFRADAGLAFPALVACFMMVAGLPLFARGLDEYEFAGGRSESWLSRWQDRARRRRGIGAG